MAKNKRKLRPLKLPMEMFLHTYLGDHNGCGVIRVKYPYLLLSQSRFVGKVSFNPSYNMLFMQDPNFYKKMFFIQWQRGATEGQLKILRHFKANISRQTNTPIVYEIDDLLIDIPEWNFAADYYKKNQKFIPYFMSEVDAISCSTEPLAKIYSKFNHNVTVIPNHLPKFLWGDEKVLRNSNKDHDWTINGKPRIVWAGSANHFTRDRNKEGGDFGKELLDFIIKTLDEYQWVIVGAMPFELEPYSSKIEFHPWQTTYMFPRYMQNLNADIGIAPLEQNVFNDCKSNLKILEYTAQGIPGVYSKCFPYKDAMTASDTEEEFIENIQELVRSPERRQEVWEHDYKLVEPVLYWEDNNNLQKYIDSYLNMFGLFLPKICYK